MRVCLWALALLALVGCGGPGDLPIAESPPTIETGVPVDRPPIVLISIDTLRSDRLPIYGYGEVETPAIDALAADGIVFERAYSHTPLTLPSHVSILTGRLPADHGVRDNLGYAFDSARTGFLPRELKHLGYATGAAVSAYVLRGTTGLATDFDVYEDRIELREGTALGGVSRPGEATLATIEPWLRSVAGDPFFLLFHIFEPHLPYLADPAGRRYAHPYDGEVAAADAVVGRLTLLLKELHTYDQALIILLSDHGEGLGDHGELEHGILLYREALQVPLVVKLPATGAAGAQAQRNAVPVQLVDVYPTILEIAGGSPAEGLPGSSLLALPADGAPRRIVAETFYPRLHYGWSDLASVIEGDVHFIDGPDPELFDLAADPRETRNLVTARRPIASDLRRHLELAGGTFEAPAAVDDETRDKLAALGYLGGAAMATAAPLPDPKAQLPTLDDLRRAAEKVAGGDLAGAVRLYRRALVANPRMLDGWRTLGDVLGRLGELEPALSAYARAFELSGGDRELGLRMAAGYEQLGRLHLERRAWEPAREASRRAVDLDPSRGEAWNQLGVADYSLENREQALDSWQKVIEIDPRHLDALYNLGTRAAELDRREVARRALSSFIEQAPPESRRQDIRRARVLLRRLERAEP